jgi:Bacterial Ig-like domain
MRGLIAVLCLALSACASVGPRVAQSVPAQGAVVAPGLAELRLTFDRPMADGRWSFVIVGEEPFPEMIGSPHLLEDRRTFVAHVRLAPATRYAVQINSGPHNNFRSADDKPAEIYVLRFSTGAP